MKRILIFSYGPVPTPEQDKVEGGGLRCWGLANGIVEQFGDSIDVTVAYHESYSKDNFTDNFQSVNITTWNIGKIQSLLVGYDSVIVSYCMGDLSIAVTDAIQANQQLILDCYVPAYIEISARQSNDIEGEYAAFSNEVPRWAHALRRGDIFLCANANQKRFYQGVLAALGRVNPATYADEMIIVVPYGVYRTPPAVKTKPITTLLKERSDAKQTYKKLLWFGGVYPWFDIKTLLKAVNMVNQTIPTKLVIVGAKNPFNAHPDFVKSYDDLIDFIDGDKESKNNVILQDWVEFDDRADWYLDSDLVILINKIGEENELAWRTRLVDYLWADLPIITNGGDPLGEELIANDAAVKLPSLTAEGMAQSIAKTIGNDAALKAIKSEVKAIREKYYWDTVVEPLGRHIKNSTRPSDIANFGLLEVISPSGGNTNSKAKRLIRKGAKVPAYYRKYGLRNTYFAVQTVAARKLGVGNNKNRPPKIVFVAHQLDTTGAPHVFIDMIRTFKNQYPALPTEFQTFNPADQNNIKELNRLGLKPRIYIAKDTPISYAKGDVIVLNTVAYSEITKRSVYDGIENGSIKKVIWYVHEDEPSLIFEQSEIRKVRTYLEQGKIELFVLAKQTQTNYEAVLGKSKHIHLESYGLNFPKNFYQHKDAKDFDVAKFILPGMMGDTRKGQLPLAYAFIEFKKRYFDKNPEKYRDFSLTYVGVGGDFPSRQLLSHTEKGLGSRFVYYPPSSHDKCLELIAQANITLCYSLRESLPLYVYEGMASGHPILRNDSSGMEEQLIDNVNGYYLDSNDFEQVVSVIEKVCNKRKTTNQALAAMSQQSVSITKDMSVNKYELITSTISNSFSK